MKSFVTSTAFALLASTAMADTITLYTSQPNADAQRTVDAFMAANLFLPKPLSSKILLVSESRPTAHLLIRIAPTIPMSGSKRTNPKNFPANNAIIAKKEVRASAITCR